MSLIQRQQACIDRMLEPRTSERRAVKNRAAAIREFRRGCERQGYLPEDIELLVIDVKQPYQLERNAIE